MADNELMDAAHALMGLIRTNIPAIKLAPNSPPANANQFPFAATWPGRGRWQSETESSALTLGTLILEIHVTAKNLPVAIETVFPLGDEIKRLLFSPTNLFLPDADGQPTVETLLLSERTGGVSWIFGDLEWGDTETIGWRIEITVKQHEVIP